MTIPRLKTPLVPYAPPVYKAKLGKALIHNRIRAFLCTLGMSTI